MKPFLRTEGIAVPIDRGDIDTDAIIPQQWLITTERTGLGTGLFANWRGDPRSPACLLDDPRYAGAPILVAGPNYGCGSSREHAVWAHIDHGIAAVVSSSFGAIFYENAINNGLLPVLLDAEIVSGLLQALAVGPRVMNIDLQRQIVTGPDGTCHPFTIDPRHREALLAGSDPITDTLALIRHIEAFQARDRLDRPWVWEAPGPAGQQ